MNGIRSPLGISLSVWRALFLREAVARLFGTRAAWFWILAQPVFQAGFLMVLYSTIRIRTVGGIDTIVWIFSGLIAFFMFRRPLTQMASAINANRALFAYRQVKPVDTVLVRGALEGFLMLVTAAAIFAAAALFDHFDAPASPLKVCAVLFGLWLLSMGVGLAVSVAAVLTAELAHLVRLSMLPLSLVSGVLFPLSSVPTPVRSWLMLNPVAHGVEGIRAAFSEHYHAVPELDLEYLYAFALGSLFLGMALQRRYALRLAAQ